MKYSVLPLLLLITCSAMGQNKMTPETLWSLHRVSGNGVSRDGKYVYYTSKSVDWKTEKSVTHQYRMGINDGAKKEWTSEAGRTICGRYDEAWYSYYENFLYESKDSGNTWKEIYNGLQDAENVWVSPNGKYVAFSKDVLIKPVLGSDIYPDLPNTTARVYTDLNDRHWDAWEDGKYSHIFVVSLKNGTAVDIMEGEPFDCPQKPFGGAEDLVWTPDSRGLVYVCKKQFGKDYAQSTNTDLYFYNIEDKKTTNWTEGMTGYDTNPVFSKSGRTIAWLSMSREGYEADKNDIVIMDVTSKHKTNLTGRWDGTVEGFIFAEKDTKIYFNAPFQGTQQVFKIDINPDREHYREREKDVDKSNVEIVTQGKWDITGIVGEADGKLIVTRTDMNHAAELYAVKPKYGDMYQLTHENDDVYNTISMSKTELRSIKTPDGSTLHAWIIYPPDFDPTRKYPTLLYCQGGPQSALSQFYSVRWNFQLMAAKGYIIVAPNRRGMPGWGVKWNEEISKDWGGLPIQDYLTAIDDVSKEPFVDKNRLGCVGASYGGYSVYMLAGMHNNRFKTFIAHDGVFDLKSWYGTTEEIWFANWDIGGPYWKQPTPPSYEKFNPSNFVNKWTAPMMIIQGGQDFRVPVEQGLEAFQAARLHNLKSKLLYLPNENHWVLHPQNGIAWQREFFKWLDETLK